MSGPADGAGAPAGGGGPAVAAAPPRAWYVAEAGEDIYTRRGRTLTVRRRDGDRVVAAIEVVSAGNKSSRNGLRQFVAKVVGGIGQGVHALVVDLFPPGPRDPDGLHPLIWAEFGDDDYRQPAGKPLTAASYEAGPVKRAYVEPAAVGDALPGIPLFLEPGVYVPAPLEAAYRAAWDGTPPKIKAALGG